jgi:hypothetical protein
MILPFVSGDIILSVVRRGIILQVVSWVSSSPLSVGNYTPTDKWEDDTTTDNLEDDIPTDNWEDDTPTDK